MTFNKKVNKSTTGKKNKKVFEILAVTFMAIILTGGLVFAFKSESNGKNGENENQQKETDVKVIKAQQEENDNNPEENTSGNLKGHHTDIESDNEKEIDNLKGQESDQQEIADLSTLKWSGKSIDLVSAAGISAEKNTDSTKSDAPLNISQDFMYGTADFAVKMLQQCIKKDENIFISPLSAQLVLAMTANGAGGETLAEMEKVLGGTQSISQLNQNLKEYTNGFINDENAYIRFADSVWIKDDNNFNVSDSFLEVAAKDYYADLYKVPFDDSTVNDVNYWVYEHTDGMIDKMVDDFSEYTRLYLLNTILFEAEWYEPYEKSIDGTFTSYNGKTENVEVMKSVEEYYIEDEMVTGFCKPYKGGYSFVALLPKEGVDIIDYASQLTGGDFIYMLERAFRTYYVKVECTLPKFTMQGTYELNDVLKHMGIQKAFEYGRADFSGILGEEHKNDIYIGDVVQKTYISVDEKGTKAAAATSVEVLATGAFTEKIYEVNLDRPFIYAIVDNQKRLPIFIGTVLDLENEE